LTSLQIQAKAKIARVRARNATALPAAANRTSTGAAPTVSASPAGTLPAAGIKFNKPYGNIGKDAEILGEASQFDD
jgi:hypothetical protein